MRSNECYGMRMPSVNLICMCFGIILQIDELLTEVKFDYEHADKVDSFVDFLKNKLNAAANISMSFNVFSTAVRMLIIRMHMRSTQTYVATSLASLMRTRAIHLYPHHVCVLSVITLCMSVCAST